MAGQYEYDLAVIGAGPGGYVAAIRAAQTGKKVCVIEKETIGGVCLNVGCIPTKAMLKSANLLRELKEAAAYGIDGVQADKLSVSMERLQERKNAVVRQLVNGVKGLLRGNRVDSISGAARFVDRHTLQVGARQLTADYIIIATGSQADIPAFIELEGENTLLTSTEALGLNDVPERTVIVGGGVIGIEFAYLLNHLGSKVTVLELMNQILPVVDEEVAALAQKRMAEDGITFQLGARVERIENNTVHFTCGAQHHTVAANAILMAVGRTPYTEGLNAEGIGIAFEKGAIITDPSLRTNIDNIYAIGDVNGKSMLAHTASHEGLTALSAIDGGSATMCYDRVPSCVYIEPEIASIGLTERQARERHDNVKTGRFPMIANGKSLVEGDTDGLVKVVVDGTYGEILGVHLYGKHATEMIAEIAVAMTGELTAEELLHAIHPHPTVSEAVSEAFLASVGKALHNL